MFPIGFDPAKFRVNWFVLQDGLELEDYSDAELTAMFNWVVLNIGRSVINITQINASNVFCDTNTDYVNAQCLMTAEFCLSHALYILQYNLISGGIDTGNKGVEGVKYITPVDWKQSWSKSAGGSLLVMIEENNGFVFGHDSDYIWGNNGISG